MKQTLALDLGTKTGWASRCGKRVESGTLDLAKLAKKQGTTRYGALWKALHTFGLASGDTVAFEDVRRHLGTRAAHVYGGLKAIVETAACDIGCDIIPVPVGTIKKHATGNGAAKKDAMMNAARKRGFEPQDDNEADALALLSYVTEGA